jgi:hypothetical protein
MRSQSAALGLTRLPDVIESVPVCREGRGITGCENSQKIRELRTFSAIGRPVEYPAAFLESLKQICFAEQLQVPRNARLALPENLRQLGNRELGFAQEQDQAKPGRIARRAQHGQKLVHDAYKHIFMCLCNSKAV